jgi:hypothetical protein
VAAAPQVLAIYELNAKPHKKAAFAVELILADLSLLSKIPAIFPPTQSGCAGVPRFLF